MRIRLRRRSEGARLARPRPEGAAGPHESRAPGRDREREEHGRRRRPPDPGAAYLSGRDLPRPRNRAPRAGRVRRRDGLPPDRGCEPAGVRAALRSGREGGRADGPRLARRPDGRRDARAERPREPAHHPDAPRRAGRRDARGRRVRTKALRHPPARRERRQPLGDTRARALLRREPFREDSRLQGDAERGPARGLLPGPQGREAHGVPRDGPLAFLHEHVPELGARPPLQVHLPQRRDQHAPRERQLDAGPAEDVLVEAVRRRPQEGSARHRHRRVRLGDVRQRPRAAPSRGPLAPARAHDDDPRAVEPARVDEPGAEGVLRVPLVLHGAVGRPGVDRLHGRDPDRRGPRPERPAPRALGRDEGRPRRHGFGGRRPRHPRRARPPEGAPAARKDVPRGHRGGTDHPRRGDQGHALLGRAVRALARGAPREAARPRRSPVRHRTRSRDRPQAPGDVRLHARGREDAREPDGGAGDRADRIDGDGHSARRPLRASPASLRLLQAAFRPGHEPAGRRGPRDDRHGGGHGDRAGGEPPRADSDGRASLRPADAACF